MIKQYAVVTSPLTITAIRYLPTLLILCMPAHCAKPGWQVNSILLLVKLPVYTA